VPAKWVPALPKYRPAQVLTCWSTSRPRHSTTAGAQSDRQIGRTRRQRGKESPSGSATAAVAKLKFTTDLAQLADRQLVIEAVLEDESVKAGIFGRTRSRDHRPGCCPGGPNTSSIPIMKLAAATANPGRVLGLHFFNPVPVLPLVELVCTLVTDEAAAASHRGIRQARC